MLVLRKGVGAPRNLDPAAQREWFEPAYVEEHRAGAVRISASDSDAKIEDFRVRS